MMTMSVLPYALVVAAGLAVVACTDRGMPGASATPANLNGQPQPLSTVTPANATMTVAKGQVLSVALPSAGDGGYAWHLETTYDTRLLAPKGERRGERPANAPLGKFADEIFDFQALAPGTTQLTFSQYRPWEGPQSATETRRIAVTIQ